MQQELDEADLCNPDREGELGRPHSTVSVQNLAELSGLGGRGRGWACERAWPAPRGGV